MYPKVLIVDDDPAGREALESILMTQNYTLAFAANGREAPCLCSQWKRCACKV